MNDNWIFQGRQYHGWFGHGTGPQADASPPSDNDGLFDPDNTGGRVQYVVSGVVGHVERGQRNRWEAALAQSSTAAFETAVIAWQNAASLSRDEFRNRLLGPDTSVSVVDSLRLAAHGIVTGRTYQDLAAAGQNLSLAVQQIGFYRWTKLIADAADRAAHAENPDKSQQSGAIRGLDTAYVLELQAPAHVDLAATGDDHPDINSLDTKLIALIKRVVEEGKLTIPDTSNPAVYGTRLHTLLAEAVKDLKIPGLAVEASFIDGFGADYGEVGTVRADVVLKDSGGHVVAVWDWKTGMFPSISKTRLNKILDAVGRKYGNVPVGIISTRLGTLEKPIP